MLASVALLLGADSSYEHVSKSVYDAARIINPSEFTSTHLLELGKSFVSRECGGRRLARLTVSTDRKHLSEATNVELPEGLPIQLLNRKFARPKIAQILCFAGRATALIRQGDKVKRYQLEGEGNASEWTVQGVPLKLVGFRLRGGFSPGSRVDQVGLPARVWLYVEAQRLPELSTVEAIRDAFQAEIGAPTYLILRTDPFFSDYEGPWTDIFAVPLPIFSREVFLSSPYVTCLSLGQGGCQLRRSR